MKKILLSAIITLFAFSVSAQQTYRTAYFMEGSTFRNHMNPAFRSDRGYINIPALGNITMGMSSNSLSIGSIFYPMPDGRLVSLLDKNVTWDEISSKLQNSNGLDINYSHSLLGFGFHSGASFWTFDLGVRTEAGFSLPKDMFEFIKNGAGSYDMSGLSVGATAYLTASLGYSRQIFENLTVGARVNYLGGILRANMRYDKLDLTLNHDIWSVNAVGVLEAAAPGLSFDDKSDDPGVIDLGSYSLFNNFQGTAGNGMTFDIGAEYVILDQITVSAAVLNMGFMKWKQSATVRGVSKASYSFEGFEIDSVNDSEMDNPEDEFSDFVNFYREDAVDFRTKIYPAVILGAEYDIFGDNLLGAGLTYMNSKTEFVHKSEIGIALTVRPLDWFTASANYMIETNNANQKFNSFGFAVNIHPSWINFFVGTDFIFTKVTPQFLPVDQKKMNLYLGLSIPLGKAKPQDHLRKLGI